MTVQDILNPVRLRRVGHGSNTRIGFRSCGRCLPEGPEIQPWRGSRHARPSFQRRSDVAGKMEGERCLASHHRCRNSRAWSPEKPLERVRARTACLPWEPHRRRTECTAHLQRHEGEQACGAACAADAAGDKPCFLSSRTGGHHAATGRRQARGHGSHRVLPDEKRRYRVMLPGLLVPFCQARASYLDG